MQSKPGRELRKLRLLLQHWWQEDEGQDRISRASYLEAALLIGAALYLNREIRADKKILVQTIKTLKALWYRALPVVPESFATSDQSAVNLIDLSEDSPLLDGFISLAAHKLLVPVFKTPLCPALIYEAFNLEERRSSNEQLQDPTRKQNSTGRQLISFTQVNTPDYIADYLLTNTLGPALQANLEANRSILAIHNTTLLDPCLGTGVFMVGAIDHFIEAYKIFGLTAEEALDQTLRHNLYGLEIDAPALATAALCLILKTSSLGISEVGMQNLLPFANLHLLADKNFEQISGAEFPLGSLRPDLREQAGHPLSRRFDVVVANPPYLGRKLMPHALKEQLRQYYPIAANDLSQAFFSLALDLVKENGYVGLIAPSSLLHLSTAKNLRRRLLTSCHLQQVVELGASVFPLLAGEKSTTALLILKNSQLAKNTDNKNKAFDSNYQNLALVKDKSFFLQKDAPLNKETIRRSQDDFVNDEGLVINFCRPEIVTALRKHMDKLADLAEIKQGLATTDNGRFLRFIWETNTLKEDGYVPYCRGEGAERWWSASTTMVLWQNQGRAIKEAVTASYAYLKGNYAWVVKNENYYFRPGLTFSFVSKTVLAVRQLPADNIFDVGSSAIFIKEVESDLWLLAYLNSSFATALAHDLNPSINMQVGDLKRLLVPDFALDIKEVLAECAQSCIQAKKELFRLTNPQHFFTTKIKSLSALQVNEGAFTQNQIAIQSAKTALRLNESKIDLIVRETLIKKHQLDVAEQAQLASFAGGKAIQTTVKGVSKFKLAAPAIAYGTAKLVEIFLHLFSATDAPCSQTLLIVIGEDNARVKKDLSKFVESRMTDSTSSIDWTFLEKSLQTAGLVEYIKSDLTKAFDYYFWGQSPLIFCSMATSDGLQKMTIVFGNDITRSLEALQISEIVTLGAVAPDDLERVRIVLAKLSEDQSISTMRPAGVQKQLSALANNIA